MALPLHDPRTIMLIIDLVASAIIIIAALFGLYAATYKIPAIHQYLNQPGTGGPQWKNLDPSYNTLRGMGLLGKNGLLGLYFFYLVAGKNYYWHQGRRCSVRLPVHTVPIELKRWILIPGWIIFFCCGILVIHLGLIVPIQSR